MAPALFDSYLGTLLCCGSGFNETGQECQQTTRQQGRKPFTLYASNVIFNRSTGSTVLPAAMPAQASVSVLRVASHGHEVAVGLGVGLPLLTATLAALAMLRRERRQRMKLAEARDPGSGNFYLDPPLPPPPPPPPPQKMLVRTSAGKVYEFEGAPVVRELPDSYKIQEVGEHRFQMI